MKYRRLKNGKYKITFEDDAWHHSIILKAIHSALTVMTQEGNIGADYEHVIRSDEDKQKIKRTLEILDQLIAGVDKFELEDNLYDELFEILQTRMRSWWN